MRMLKTPTNQVKGQEVQLGLPATSLMLAGCLLSSALWNGPGAAWAAASEGTGEALRASGAAGWAIASQGAGADWGNAVSVDKENNVFVATAALPNVPGEIGAVLHKYTPGGMILWSNRLGGIGSVIVRYTAVDSNGDVLVAGQLSGRIDLGGGALSSAGGPYDLFVAKFSGLTGEHIWSRSFGGAGSDVANGLAVDPAGNAVLTGHIITSEGRFAVILMKVSGIDGNVLWQNQFVNFSGGVNIGSGVVIDNSGDIVVTGHFGGIISFGGQRLIAVGGEDIFVAKFTSEGVHIWSERFGGPDEDHATGITVDRHGEIAVVGYFRENAQFGPFTVISSGQRDILVGKLSATGLPLWVTTFGGSGNDQAYGVATGPQGNVMLTGDFQGKAAFGGQILESTALKDIFIAECLANGRHVWARTFNSTWESCGNSIACDNRGCLVVTGYFSLDFDLGGTRFNATGGPDGFLLKLPPSGRLP